MSGDRRSFDWDRDPEVAWPGDPEDRGGYWFGSASHLDRDTPFTPFRYNPDLINRHYGVGKERW